ncbi:sortase [Candidatus Falkowbacteria bacterium CG11_big_fil_rev_8_21_14_0_20_39_10]|uniref:Sortase n=1 Tax=Candidatus Falkowbacteria bacterium CG11_big_fil_rev_8_21_14_0_20_39_10 TaxID=1974570 RepID=A0A2M6K9V1_9BACT|nr:MAG: sortase [Candidatus Falkowbacteria bacterium CG11_big_fil_rev_8_21_14_0_20_39_10]
MQLKILLKRTLLLAVILSGLTLFIALLLYFIPKNSIQGSSAVLVENAAAQSNQEQVSQEGVSIGLPVRLKIPVISVDSAVIPVGLTPDGAMDVPKDPAEVAWYSLGPRPGESGSAVIAGHYDWIKNILAVFDNLHKLSKGDKISVEDENGVATTFVVREIRIYGKDEDASNVFGSDDDKAHLNLITCTGVWNKAKKIYSNRLIVFTDRK